MGRVLFGYGLLRGTALKHRKTAAIFGIIVFAVFLCYSYVHEGRPGKVRSMDMDYYGPDLMDSFTITHNYDEDALKKLAIGEVGLAPMDADRAVENLIEMEEEVLVQSLAKTNGSILGSKPVYDKNGNEIGLRFLVISDWGGQDKPPYTTSVQMKVGRAMSEIASQYDSSFILSLGDNFCDRGVKNVDDLRFEDTFEDVFTQPSLQRPWYVIAGDVDYRGNVSAEIEYTNKSSRWSFESEYYKMSAQLSTFKNVSVDFVMIDTVELCGRLPPSGLMQPMGPDDIKEAEAQWAWIDNTLKASGAEYLVVAGHYPIYSGGRHGSTKCLIDRLQPMLKKYHASAYFCGHDHSMQHIKATGTGGVHYFVSGAANDKDDRPDHLDGIYRSTKYFWTNHLDKTTGAFTYCDVRKDEMRVAFVHSDKSVLYMTKVLPRSHPSNKVPEAEVTDPQQAVKIPVLQKHKPQPQRRPVQTRYRPPQARFVPQKLRPKSRQQLIMEQRKRQQQLQLQQQHAIQNANRMMHRYRGP